MKKAWCYQDELSKIIYSQLHCSNERNIKMNDKPFWLFNDDWTKTDLIKKTILWLICKKDDDPSEEFLCSLNIIDQKMENLFIVKLMSQKGKRIFNKSLINN